VFITAVPEHSPSHEESSFHMQGKKTVSQSGDVRHWRTASRAVSCSGLCTALQYIPPRSEVSALWGEKVYWQDFSDLIAVRVKYVAEKCCDFVAQERFEKRKLSEINATFRRARRH